jgi:hypothetical protein
LQSITAFGQAIAEPILKDGWIRVHVENIGSIDLPPTLELQGGTYKEINDKLYTFHNISTYQLIAQQKGLNDLQKHSFNKYARVMINTNVGNHGDYEKLDFDISGYNKSDILEIDKIWRQQSELQLSKNKDFGEMKIIEWYPIRLEKIGEMSCLHIKYLRQLNNNPVVLVNMYIFHNTDREHILTMSHRLSDLEYWGNDFLHILNSFRVTHIR